MKKTTIAIILIVCLLAAVTAYAVNEYILSEPVTVIVEDYDLTLSVNATTCMKGETLLFNGTLTSDTWSFQDVNVTLWCDDFYTGLWDLTDAEGYYEILYLADTVGSFDFYANATIT